MMLRSDTHQSTKLKAARLSVASNLLLVIFKLVIGTAMGSVSVVSEAVHSAIDLMASLIAVFSIHQASKPADDEHPYGHGKIENISGVLEALLILIAGIYIIYEAVLRLFHPGTVEKLGWGVAVMATSSIVNFVISQRLLRVARSTRSVALEADAWHLRVDVYTSLGVVIGLVLIQITGFRWLDPVVAIAVALLILKTAWDLTRKAFADILDTTLSADEMQIIHACLAEFKKEFIQYHDIRSRKSGNVQFLEFHLVVPAVRTIGQSHELCDRIEARLAEVLPGTLCSIHLEPCSHTELEGASPGAALCLGCGDHDECKKARKKDC